MIPSPIAAADITARTDKYFNRTSEIVGKFGDRRVTYAVFLRRPVVSAPGLMVDWLNAVAAERNTGFDIELTHPEGSWVGAGEPLAYITGSFLLLADLETIFLQKIGAACVAAHNAFQMCVALPKSSFLAMDARHCAGAEMQEMMAYAAAVGSKAAQREGAKGFIGNANDWTAHFFGASVGYGTMPHALIGYAGSTLRAAEMFVETFPEENLTVLVDYFGKEVTDALIVCRRFPEMAREGQLAVRLDTHGGRFLEGLDPQESYAVLERHAPGSLRRYRSQSELRFLIGTGVSAAAIWRMSALPPAPVSAWRNAASWPMPMHRSMWSGPAVSFRKPGRRPMPRRISWPMTGNRWSKSGGSFCSARRSGIWARKRSTSLVRKVLPSFGVLPRRDWLVCLQA
jgi:nicotinate phosphoribosyltransferase